MNKNNVFEEITKKIHIRELRKLTKLVDEFLASKKVDEIMMPLKEYYMAEYLLYLENKRPKRSDVLTITSTPKK